MKLFSKTEIQALEQAGISLSEMMDRAGASLARLAVGSWGLPSRAALLCGRGNNGGDGFVCAGELAGMGVVCTVILLHGEPGTKLSRAAFDRLPGAVRVLGPGAEAKAALRGAGLIVDCVYGFGFKGELDGVSAEYLGIANESHCHKLAADLPSGAECDSGRACKDTFRADITAAFTGLKPAHVSYPAKEFCGEVRVCQVGVPEKLTAKAETLWEITGPERLSPLLELAGAQAHKGSRGRLLMVCGSWGMAGCAGSGSTLL